ncbi:DinB family protein [Flavobacterium sp.]|uniref:DinB family protein n=1 Tax=Flavobacterium sp. TaxID=239 RepID=UPI0025C566C1|nr:DinB family protein [Flavobacterium sp.]
MENLKNKIQPTFDAMAAAIRNTPDSEFNNVPFPGSWTPAQAAQHIKLSIQNLPGMLQGKTEASDRKPDEKVKMVADVFLDFDTKMKSPESIEPQMREYDKSKMSEFYETFGSQLEDVANRLDLSEICLDFEIPVFGPMTRLEWIAFALFHTQRHTRQIENMSSERV